MWHVSSRSGVATLRTAIHLLLTCYLLAVCSQRGVDECTCGVVRSTSASSEADDDAAERSAAAVETFSTGQSLSSAPTAAAAITLLLLNYAVSLRDNPHCCLTRLLIYLLTM